MGIEPTSEAWEASILPLNYARSVTTLSSGQLFGNHRSKRGGADETVLEAAGLQNLKPGSRYHRCTRIHTDQIGLCEVSQLDCHRNRLCFLGW